MVRAPDGLGPRSLQPGEGRAEASLEGAERLGMGRYGAGAFAPAQCDAFGRVAANEVMARLGDGSAQEIAVIRAAAGADVGVAVVEYRLTYLDWPQAGDRYDIRSGLKTVEPRRLRMEHWILDPDSGRPWATADVVLLPFDLGARKTSTLSEAALKALQAAACPFD
jgi:acyl-CoA thioester hydrolase